jgi:hypothetical protein
MRNGRMNRKGSRLVGRTKAELGLVLPFVSGKDVRRS